MKKIIYSHFNSILTVISLFSIFSFTEYWLLSLIPLIFYVWNFFNKNLKPAVCITLSLFIILSITFNFYIIQPSIKKAEEFQVRWNKTGYDSTWVNNSQEMLNVFVKAIERYHNEKNEYPSSLKDIKEIRLIDFDFSYRIKYNDSSIYGIPFYYEKVDSESYYLTSVGKDGIPKTNDDLLPQIKFGGEKKVGLIKYDTSVFLELKKDRVDNILNTLEKVDSLEKASHNKKYSTFR